jgi:hypothetical protein
VHQPEEIGTMKLLTLRRGLIGLLLAAGLLVGVASPANAVIVGNTDRPKISASGRDFGNNFFISGPLNGGIVNWDLTNNVITPWISGQLYLNNMDNDCTRIWVIYHDSSGDELGTRQSSWYCPSDNRSHQYTISISSFGDPDVDHVHIRLEGDDTGSWLSYGQATEYIWS